MKKTYLMIVAIACMAFAVPAYADGDGEQVDLEVTILDPTTQNGGPHKSSPQIPLVFLDDHTLYFDAPCDGCTLQLLNEEEEIVYTVVLSKGTTEWDLPDGLFGKYQLQIIRRQYCFFGWIEL